MKIEANWNWREPLGFWWKIIEVWISRKKCQIGSKTWPRASNSVVSNVSSSFRFWCLHRIELRIGPGSNNYNISFSWSTDRFVRLYVVVNAAGRCQNQSEFWSVVGRIVRSGELQVVSSGNFVECVWAFFIFSIALRDRYCFCYGNDSQFSVCHRIKFHRFFCILWIIFESNVNLSSSDSIDIGSTLRLVVFNCYCNSRKLMLVVCFLSVRVRSVLKRQKRVNLMSNCFWIVTYGRWQKKLNTDDCVGIVWRSWILPEQLLIVTSFRVS